MPRNSKAVTVGVVAAIDSPTKETSKSSKSPRKSLTSKTGCTSTPSKSYRLTRERSALLKKNNNFDDEFNGEVEQRDEELRKLMDKIARVEAEILSVKTENEAIKVQISKLNAENVDLNEKKQSLMWQCRKLQRSPNTSMDEILPDVQETDDDVL